MTEFASLGIFFALSHFLQVQLGYPALAAGALLTVVIATAILTAPTAESLTGRVDVRWLFPASSSWPPARSGQPMSLPR